MKHQETLVVGGVDAHADSHHAAALDERGALLGSEGFATTSDGYGEFFRWLSSFGRLAVVGVESSGCYAAGLVRYLRSEGVRVLEVNEPHAHARRRVGKSDPIDAELAAQLALAGKATTVPSRVPGLPVVARGRSRRRAAPSHENRKRTHGAPIPRACRLGTNWSVPPLRFLASTALPRASSLRRH
jgi:transposase